MTMGMHSFNPDRGSDISKAQAVPMQAELDNFKALALNQLSPTSKTKME
jgi:hypothetical protein